MNIGKVLREERQKRGITMKKLAELAGLDVSTLWKAENRNTGLSSISVGKLAKALSVPYEFFAFKAIGYKDIPEAKREAFDLLQNPINALLECFISENTLNKAVSPKNEVMEEITPIKKSIYNLTSKANSNRILTIETKEKLADWLKELIKYKEAEMII